MVTHEIPAARRTLNFNYAIRNIVGNAKALEARGRTVRYLNIGDPLLYAFTTPPELVEAVARALRDNRNGYAPSVGLLEAREAVARHMTRRGVATDADDVVIGSGASEAADLLLTAMIEPGDEVLTPVPSYPLYSAILSKLGAVEKRYHLDPAAGWAPDVAEISRLCTEKTRAIVVIHPNNPTGSVYADAQLQELLAVIERHGLVLLADEVYAELGFEGPTPAMAQLSGGRVPIVTLDSFSKSFLVPGWRLGWLSFSHHPAFGGAVRAAVRKLAEGRLCSAGPAQYAIKIGLDGPKTHLRGVVERMRSQTNFASERLARIPGVSCVPAGGAFYLMPRVPLRPGETDEQFVLSFLEATGNLVVHGSGFNLDPKLGHFRLVTLPTVEELGIVLDDLERFIQNR
ncbi:MAG: aminotransferase class I/II-fold pyridoxal phosphate-dependent enzyme [Acidobacteriota bacterium]